MPKLPTFEALGFRDPRAAYDGPTYPTSSPVAEANARMGAALQGLGQTVAGIAMQKYREEEAKGEALTAAEAQSGWTTDKLTLDRKYTPGAEGADAEYGTWSQRHQAELEERRQAHAARFTDPQKRALFLANTADDLVASNQRVSGRAFEVVRAENRERLSQTIEQDVVNEAAPNATDEDREKIRLNRLAKIEGAVKDGRLLPAEGLALSQATDARSAKLILARMEASQRLEAFGQQPERPAPTLAGLKLKSGEAVAGGDVHPGTVSLAHTVQGAVPELKYFSALNDKYHQGTKSHHAKGLGMDFTLNDPSKSGQATETVRGLLAKAGLTGKDYELINEYEDRSHRSTGGHIHVAFRSPEAAAKFAGLPAPGSAPPVAAGGWEGALIKRESSGRPDIVNDLGYAGLYQMGAPLLTTLGVYRPGENEDLKGWSKSGKTAPGKWSGTFDIPGFPNVKTLDDFRNNPAAQKAAFQKSLAHYDKEIADRGLDKYIGQEVGGVKITREGIYSMMHLGGPGGAHSALVTDGRRDARDANGSNVLSYARMAVDAGTAPVTPANRYVARLSPEDQTTLYKGAAADVAKVAVQRGEEYENQILQASVGQASLPSREAIQSDPRLDLTRRNAVLRMHDAASGRVAAAQTGDLVETYERNFIDAQEDQGGLIERAVIENDPRLDKKQKNDLLVKRDAVRRNIDTGAFKAAEAQKKAAADDRELLYKRMFADAEVGKAAIPPREVIENDRTIDEKQRITLLEKHNSASKNANELGAAVARLNSGALDATGFSSETHKDVNRIVASQIPSPAIMLSAGQEGVDVRARITDIARRTGYVADAATDRIRSGLVSPDPKDVEAAVQFASQIMDKNPNAFATSPGAGDIQQSVRAFEHYVDTMGKTPAEAAAIVAQTNDPVWRAKFKKSEEDIRTFEKTIRDDDAGINDLRKHMARFPLGFGRPEAGFTARDEASLLADYTLSARLHYERLGDPEAAKKLARLELLGDPAKGTSGVYGVTLFNGTRTLMKHAPEAAPGYPAMPDIGKAYIYDQAIEHVKATAGVAVSRDDLSIDTTGRNTAEGFKRGLQVPYRLFYKDKDGTVHLAKANSPIGWVADPTRARAEWEARAAAQGAANKAAAIAADPLMTNTPSSGFRADPTGAVLARDKQEAVNAAAAAKARVEEVADVFAPRLENERKRQQDAAALKQAEEAARESNKIVTMPGGAKVERNGRSYKPVKGQ